MLVSWNMASFGRLDEAEAAARSSIERFDAVGEVFLVVNSLNALAGIMAAKGDIEGASVGYEVLLRRCRATGEHPYLNSALVALAVLRARQGDDAAADDLDQEAITSSSNPWLYADAMVGQAAVARRLGDWPGPKGCSTPRQTATETQTFRRPAPGTGRTGLVGARGRSTRCRGHFAADAVSAAGAIGEPETQLLADSALAAAKAIADPTRHNADNFVSLAQQRTQGPAHRSLTDEPDLLALATRLTPAAI